MAITHFSQKIIKFFLKNYKNLSEEELRALSTSILVFFQGVLVGIVFLPVHYPAGGINLVIYSLLVSLCGLISLFLIRHENFSTVSRLFFIFSCNILIFFNSKAIGLQGGLQYFFAPTVSLPFLMFNAKQTKIHLFLSFIPPVFLGSLLYLTPHWEIVPRISMSEQHLMNYGFTSIAVALSMVSFSIYQFYKMIGVRDLEILEKNKQIFHAEKLSSLGILSSGVAHEINNPLAVIVGSATQLKREMKSGSLTREESVLKLERIIKMTERINKIVKSLNTYNQNDANSPIVATNLNEIIEEAFTFFKKDMEIKEISFSVINKTKNVQHALARESCLLQVFIILFSNSIDALKLEAAPAWIKIELTELPSGVEIIFSDSGLGIPLTLQEKIFDPFYTSKKVGEGTGLGLYISKNLMESMSGKIEYLLFREHTSFKLTLRSSHEVS